MPGRHPSGDVRQATRNEFVSQVPLSDTREVMGQPSEPEGAGCPQPGFLSSHINELTNEKRPDDCIVMKPMLLKRLKHVPVLKKHSKHIDASGLCSAVRFSANLKIKLVVVVVVGSEALYAPLSVGFRIPLF